MNFASDVATNIPICDCTAPFSVNFITDAQADAQSAAIVNRGNEPIHVVNVSLNVSLNDYHQKLKYQSYDQFLL